VPSSKLSLLSGSLFGLFLVFLSVPLTAAAQPTAPNEWTWMGGSSTIPSCPANSNCAQSGWYGTLQTPAAANVPEGRSDAVSWTDAQGNLWLFGGVGIQGTLNDLWKFDPATAEWTWMAGSGTLAYNPSTGSGQPGVYGTLGTPAAGNTPGSRSNAVSWTGNDGKLWLFGGYGFDANGDVNQLNDLWRFDPSTNEWAWMGGLSTLSCVAANECWGQPGVYGTLGTPSAANIPGGREEAVSWTDQSGNFWLYGGLGADSNGRQCPLNDLWKFNPPTNEWTWMGVNGSQSCTSWQGEIEGNQASVGTFGDPGVGVNPGSLQSPMGWTDRSGNLWLFGGFNQGYNISTYSFLMFEFYPSNNEWAWMGDGGTSYPAGREAAAGWTDSNGNFWLFGGSGYVPWLGPTSDLWEFNPSINVWASIGGSNNSSSAGVYGALGTPAPGNLPGARSSATTWTDNSGNLWLFGGLGIDSQGTKGLLNDLWQFSLNGNPSVVPLPSAATPTFSLAAGIYGSAQPLTISDTTPGATIYYTTDGSMPNSNSAVYSGQISVSSSETVAAVAIANGCSVSGLTIAKYTIGFPPAAAPYFYSSGGTYTTGLSLTIADSTSNATIYYTTDGTTPTINSTVYTAPISISITETIEAIAIAPSFSASAVTSATYTIPPYFSITIFPASLSLTAGKSGTATVTVQGISGFNSAVSLACSDLPAGVSCSFSQLTVPDQSNTSTSTLTVNTTTDSTRANSAILKRASMPWLPASTIAVVVCCFGLRKRRRWQTGLLLVMGMAGLGLLSGCAVLSKFYPQPTYQPIDTFITITATSGSLSNSTGLALTVN
jgi:N-acetylneuraminic acid mutarotase